MSDTKKIRIVSDGTSQGTRVFDDYGTELTSAVEKVEWSVDGKTGIARAHVTFLCAEVEVLGALA